MRLRIWFVCSMVYAATVAHAQSPEDEAALRKLPVSFGEAWNRHDAHELAQIMAEDVDFVNVGAVWLHGRLDFETYHSRLLAGGLRESSTTPLETAVRFIKTDLAVVHWSWRVDGDRNLDGSARQRAARFGLMTMVAEKRGGNWLIVAAQNTNGVDADVSSDPRMQGITRPIAVPRNGSTP
jgi:uncharacterized protein (TIGR02246 family)